MFVYRMPCSHLGHVVKRYRHSSGVLTIITLSIAITRRSASIYRMVKITHQIPPLENMDNSKHYFLCGHQNKTSKKSKTEVWNTAVCLIYTPVSLWAIIYTKSCVPYIHTCFSLSDYIYKQLCGLYTHLSLSLSDYLYKQLCGLYTHLSLSEQLPIQTAAILCYV